MLNGVLDPRSSDILRHVVEAYLETREPVGSRTLSRRLGMTLSPATIRNVMADLEEYGLLFSPHTSAGRLPTDEGIKLFVHGFLELGNLTTTEEERLKAHCKTSGKSLSHVLEEITLTLSGLSECAGLVLAPKTEQALKHIEFVYLREGQALVILTMQDGMVENRIIGIPRGLAPAQLVEASNYMNHHLVGHRLEEGQRTIKKDLADKKAQLDDLSAQVVEKGLAIRGGDHTKKDVLIVRGQSHLLNNVREMEDLKTIKALFETLDRQESFLNLIEETIAADGVQIFIGSENSLFQLSGCSVIMSSYGPHDGEIVGAIGVVGPTHMNYGRIVPLVNYTARLIGKVISS